MDLGDLAITFSFWLIEVYKKNQLWSGTSCTIDVQKNISKPQKEYWEAHYQSISLSNTDSLKDSQEGHEHQ